MKIFISVFLTALCSLAVAQFTEPIIIDAEHFGSAEICTGDLNSDGLPDMIVASAYSVQSIDGYLNLGNGMFSERQVLLSGTWTMHYDIASADLDSDGDDDILTFVKDSMNGSALTMSWLRNDAGLFSDPILIENEIASQVELLTVDLDNDGDLDIAMSDDASVRVYLNEGDGNFSAPDVVAVNNEHYAVEAADFDGDGFKDLLISTGNLWVYFNDHVGGFPEPVPIEVPFNVDPFFLTSADYNDDGAMDFATWSSFHPVHLMLNMGDGTVFSTEEITSDAFASYSIHSADIDNDGDLDLLCTYDQTSAVVWFANDGQGEFSEEIYVYQQTDFIGLQSIIYADLDLDGDVEVIWGAVNQGLFYHDNLSLVSSLDEFNIGTEKYLDVFPNPASSSMTIELTAVGLSLSEPSMLIFNMNAQWMMEEIEMNQQSAIYDLSHLSAGHYLLELRSEGVVVERRKVVVE